jgi:hypothetical protein
MATHQHLVRGNGTDYVTPADVEDLRVLHRGLREGSPLREVAADLLLALCSAAETAADVTVDIGRGKDCHRSATPSRSRTH